MAFQVIYKPLFEVVIRHDFFLNQGETSFEDLDENLREGKAQKYDIQSELVVEPTIDTREIMAGLGLIFRTTSTGFFVAVKADELDNDAYTPFFKFPSRLNMRFMLRLKEGQFANYTNIYTRRGAKGIYYFNNQTTSGGRISDFREGLEEDKGDLLSLSVQPSSFMNGRTYHAGEVVVQSNELFLSKFNEVDQAPQDDTDSWLLLDGKDYVNENDRVALYPVQRTVLSSEERLTTFNLIYRFPEQGAVNAAFTMLDLEDKELASGGFDLESGERPLGQFPFQIGTIRRGRFTLKAEWTDGEGNLFSSEEAIYLDDTLPLMSLFGLIEIVHDSALGEYSLIDTDEEDEILSPHFGIRFLNRHTYWRYFYKHPPQGTKLGDLEKVGDWIITKSIKPLTTSFIGISDGTEDLLPNPDTGMIKSDAEYAFSDIFIHN